VSDLIYRLQHSGSRTKNIVGLLHEAADEIGRLRKEIKRLESRCKILRDGLHGISYTIEMNNEQNGFWGVASAHGLIRRKCIDALEADRKAGQTNG